MILQYLSYSAMFKGIHCDIKFASSLSDNNYVYITNTHFYLIRRRCFIMYPIYQALEIRCAVNLYMYIIFFSHFIPTLFGEC